MYVLLTVIAILLLGGFGFYYYSKESSTSKLFEKEEQIDPMDATVLKLLDSNILFNRNEPDNVLREQVSSLITGMLELADTPYSNDAMYKRMTNVYFPNLIKNYVYVNERDKDSFSVNIEELDSKVRKLLTSVKTDNQAEFERTSMLISGMLSDTDKGI